eukprot:10908316-Heterocapsa_arctica.AAC.1
MKEKLQRERRRRGSPTRSASRRRCPSIATSRTGTSRLSGAERRHARCIPRESSMPFCEDFDDN